MDRSTLTQEIITWARSSLSGWQSDLVRRFLESGSISKTDIDEMYLAVLADADIELPDGKQPPSVRKPELGKISGAPQESIDVSIRAIRELQNVNQIPNRSALTFGESGLTVVYGENGAGKSGWARLLKRACRAKDEELPILSNVYEDPNSEPASAVFEVIIGGKSGQEVAWTDGSNANDVLTNVTVFDSKSAGAIVNENNTFIYVPDVMQVFRRLADAISDIREKLEREKPRPSPPSIPGIDPTSSIGQRLADLHNAGSIESLKAMVVWSESDVGKLDSLTQIMAEVNAADVEERVSSRQAQIGRISNVLNRLVDQFQLLDESQLRIYASQGRELAECRKAAKIATAETLTDEPLDGAGSDAWEKLYRAAKAFSEELAYPDRLYPPVDNGDRCVLCMQELSPEARTRMIRFDTFIKGKVQEELEKARVRVNKSRKRLESLGDVEMDQTLGATIEEIESLDASIATYLRQWIERNRNSRTLAFDLLEGKEHTGELSPHESPEATIEALITRLKKENQELEATLDPVAANSLRNELIEIQSRKVAFDHWSDIEMYWLSIESSRKYEAAIGQINTTSITRKSKDMMSSIVSDKLNAAVVEELSQLGAKRLSLELTGHGEKGAVKYRYGLANTAVKTQFDLQRILSEGEQRVVALAGFLAEENLTGRTSAIVFDDPVSSLDHLFCEKIAARLVKASQRRQVIVFTHDIAFLFLLQEKSGGLPMFVHTLRRFGNTVGKPESGLPWHATQVKKRIVICRDLLQEARKTQETDPAKYDQAAAKVYAHLRETWEAAVEEAFLNGAIIRHGHTVQTKRLQKVSLTDEHYVTIERGMAK